MAAPAVGSELERAIGAEPFCLDTCNTSHGIIPRPAPSPRERNAVLAGYLARDPDRGRWAYHKAHGDRLARKLEHPDAGLLDRAARMRSCAEILTYDPDGQLIGPDHYCGQRLCPVCQSKRATRWAHRVRDALPQLEQLPGEWAMLTLTMRSIPFPDTRRGIRQLHRAVDRLAKRKEWAARGWIRQTEITANVSAGSAHPHCHLLLLLPADYYETPAGYVRTGARGKPRIQPGYMTQKRIRELWARALGADYDPRVDIRPVRMADAKERRRAILEICKYGVKPAELAGLAPADLATLTSELASHRTFSVCGELRRYIPPPKATQFGRNLALERLIRRNDPPGRWQGPVPLSREIGHVAKWDPERRGFDLFGAGLGIRGRPWWVARALPPGPDLGPIVPAEWIGDVWGEPENLAPDDRAERRRLAELEAKRPEIYKRE